MTRRYEFTGNTRSFCGRVLHEIKALVAISTAIGLVNVGDVGGWIEKEENLPHNGKAWVYPEATVCGERTCLYGGTFLGGTFEGGTFLGGTFWGGTFRGGTFLGGTFLGGTFLGGTFRIEDTTVTQPVFLAGFEYDITITDAHIGIGCQHHPIIVWLEQGPDIASRNGCAEFYRQAADVVKGICASTGRLPAKVDKEEVS